MSPPSMPPPPPSSQQQQRECHVLPCKIDYSGKALDYIYFHPQNLPSSSQDKDQQRRNEDGSSCTNNTTEPSSFRAVQFRGRGLLACNNDSNNHHDDSNGDEKDQGGNANVVVLRGRVLRNNKTARNASVQSVAKFGSFTEWHHEHEPSRVVKALEQRQQQQDNATTGIRAAQQRAQEWCQIASVLHRPIPIMTDTTMD